MIKKFVEYMLYPTVMLGTYSIYMVFLSFSVPEIISVYCSISLGVLAIVSIEYLNPYRASWSAKTSDYLQDFTYLVLVQLLLPLAIRFSMLGILIRYGFNQGVVFDIWPRTSPLLIQVLLIIFIGEFFQYWWHRISHSFNFLWRIHSVHHFPKILYSVNTARFHPADKIVEYFFDIFFFIMIGAEISVIYLYYIYFSINGFFQHCNINVRLGFFNYVVATAELHRLHHDVDAEEGLCNFGNNTIFWDLVFGTYKSSINEVKEIGVDSKNQPNTFVEQMIFPFKLNLKKSLRRYLMNHKYKQDWIDFNKLTHNPNETQLLLLKKILKENQSTLFGKEYNFTDIKNYEDYKNKLEVNEYEFFRPWIDKIISGEKNILTKEDVHYFVTTSGTTGLAKYVPMTQQLEESVKKMQNVLIYSLFNSNEDTFSGQLFTVVGSAVEETVGQGFECGSMSGKLYAKTSRLIKKFQAVPCEVYEIEDYDLKYRLLATIALLSPTTTLFTTANPSTLLKLDDVLNEQRDQIFELISSWDFLFNIKNIKNIDIVKSINWNQYKKYQKRALHILSQEKSVHLSDVFPDLKSVVTWTKGSCSYLIPSLKKIIPKDTSIIELGYLSSEFRGTINSDYSSAGTLPTLGQNFFEFIHVNQYSRDDCDVLLIGDLVVGEQYYIIVTTPAGLYRYFINDIVVATEKVNNCPGIEFVQKGKGVTNITGEKLCEGQVLNYFNENEVDITFFICLADPIQMEYRLYFEGPFEDFSDSLHKYLCEVNVEYKAKTESHRLKPIRTVKLKDCTGELFKATQVANGQRDSQLKHLHLDYIDNVKFVFEAWRK